VPVSENVLQDFETYPNKYPLRLNVHLGAGSDVFNGSTLFQFPFKVYENPTIYEWESLQSFKIYEGQTHITINVRITSVGAEVDRDLGSRPCRSPS